MSIDYGRFPMENGQLPNRDPETSIRYGIVSPHDLADWVFDEMESEYGHGCPHCGEETKEPIEDAATCPSCGEEYSEDDQWTEEPIFTYLECDGVRLEFYEIGVWIVKSPVKTVGRHASPCAPGAVTIERKPNIEGGVLCYGLPLDWWRDDR